MSKLYKNMSYDRALEKAMKYCSYQERCQLDLIHRFMAWQVNKSEWDNILDYLIEENYLNEDRYVEAFIRGKFRIKRWGRNKIKLGLKNKHVYSERKFNTIFESEITEEDYLETIKELIKKKTLILTEQDKFKMKDKLYRYMLSKGFESELISNELKTI